VLPVWLASLSGPPPPKERTDTTGTMFVVSLHTKSVTCCLAKFLDTYIISTVVHVELGISVKKIVGHVVISSRTITMSE
jgi:hypothetical protein